MKHFKQTLIIIFMFQIILCLCDIQMGTFNDNVYYESHVIIAYDKMGPKMCGRHCLYQKSCNAVNYNHTTFVCELITKAAGDSALTQTGSRYSAMVTWSLQNDPCYPNPCTGRQKCMKTKDGGYYCGSIETPCDNEVCNNGGTCKNLVSSFECKCAEGYSGSLCEQSLCDNVVCNNGGTCQANGLSVECVCVDGYTGPHCEQIAVDCGTYKDNGVSSGVYKIFIDAVKWVDVYCDMNIDGGGWTVFQNRFNGSTDFYHQTWSTYKIGFGNLNGEFWLGNENVYLMTKHSLYLMRVDLETAAGGTAYAQYTTFMLNAETDKYRLTLEGYSGTSGDGTSGMSFNKGKVFSTPDQDSTGSYACPTDRNGSWWYYSCANANLNGLWMPGTSSSNSMCWYALDGWKGLRKASMKIRKK